ncbi:MAG: cell division protein FtsZ, partial [Muribaculaceae bacterium]|nr:cell division protein FtsZ [Muribaculaceae bacterium]
MAPDDTEYLNKYENNSDEPNHIVVIGVGGGGNNAVNYMYRQDIQSVSFVVANTDRQALESSPVPNKLLLGPTVTRGRGAGAKPERARAAAEESATDIDKVFDDDVDMVFVTAGMGGGTGTGAAPVVARIARERG